MSLVTFCGAFRSAKFPDFVRKNTPKSRNCTEVRGMSEFLSKRTESGLLTTMEAADYLRIEKRTLENWRTSGRGPVFVRIGGAVRYRTVALERFISAGERASTAKARA